MQHTMNLDEIYYNLTKQGLKHVEFRLNDKKRQLLSIGDTIKFINKSNSNDIFTVSIKALKYAKSFEEILLQYNSEDLGFDKSLLISILDNIYKKKDMEKYGVIGIEF